MRDKFVCNETNVLNLVAYLNWPFIFEWDVIWCGFKNGYKKYMNFKEIGFCADNVITILDSIGISLTN